MSTKYYDALVVGGGFGGITELFKLREAGYSVHGFERGTYLGGVWHHNRYPGARVDTEVPCYQLWLEETCKGWIFSERFPGYKELQNYFEYADSQIHVSKDYTFESNVSKAHWDQANNMWDVQVTGKGEGNYRCKYLILCIGFAAKKMYPPGVDTHKFKSTSFHTADWPWEGVDVKNKRVAVVGTGASGVQVVQEIGADVKELVVFQRTPNTALPMRQRTDDPKDKETQMKRRVDYPKIFRKLRETSYSGFEFEADFRAALECTPEEIKEKFDDCWEKGGFRFWLGNFKDVFVDPKTNEIAYKYWREKVFERVKDPRKREILAPAKQVNPIFTKRPSLEQRYYEIFNQDNVNIVNIRDTPITEVTETGLRTLGKEYEFDIIIYATGFDSITGGFYQIDLKGDNGVSLQETWKNGTYTHLGMTIYGYPNLFFMYGPQGPSAFCNGPTCALTQSEWIRDAINYTEKNKYKRIMPTLEAQLGWKKYIKEGANSTLLPIADSWYMGVNREGNKPKECLLYVYGANNYLKDISKEAENNYENFAFL